MHDTFDISSNKGPSHKMFPFWNNTTQTQMPPRARKTASGKKVPPPPVPPPPDPAKMAKLTHIMQQITEVHTKHEKNVLSHIEKAKTCAQQKCGTTESSFHLLALSTEMMSVVRSPNNAAKLRTLHDQLVKFTIDSKYITSEVCTNDKCRDHVIAITGLQKQFMIDTTKLMSELTELYAQM